MANCFITKTSGKTIPIIPICQDEFLKWQKSQSKRIRNLIAVNNFAAKSGTFCLINDVKGKLAKILLGLENKDDFLAFGALPKILPKGYYVVEPGDFSLGQLEHAAIGWGMGSYQFTRYKKKCDIAARLVCGKKYNIDRLNMTIDAIFLVRDLINTAASDLYPEKLAEVATNLARRFSAKLKIIKGKDLAEGFPAVHAVGRASINEPLLIDLQYGNPKHPKIALVGKGVCFDSGGLQIKPSSGMVLMKKDMAGAAHVLGLAQMIMQAKLPVNLRVIIPAVENLISGNALKPGDVIPTRKGLSVEVLNTDAEGRLILADALTYASEWQPDLILDFATLTGAARVALGPDITALFANDLHNEQVIMKNLLSENEPVWPLPLYQPYLEFLKGKIADLQNIARVDYANGGAILAALFLQQFVGPGISWVHFDMNAYNAVSRPGRPEGGEAVCLKGVFGYIKAVLNSEIFR